MTYVSSFVIIEQKNLAWFIKKNSDFTNQDIQKYMSVSGDEI